MTERTNPMLAPADGVRVRMYNPGFGDCFLLAFPGPAGASRPVYVLIDCGVHGSYRGGSEQIRGVIRDIRDSVRHEGESRLDLVVVTHEHADHVSGFYLGRGIFEGEGEEPIHVDRAWFGWTENPEDERARSLDRARSLMLQGLAGAHQALGADDDEARMLESLLGFYASETEREEDRTLPLGGRLLGVSTRKSRDRIRDHAREVEYLKPKIPPRAIPGVDGVRVFVLGPPEDERALLSPDPTGEEGEVYEEEEAHPLYLQTDRAMVSALAASGKLPAGVGQPPSGEFQPFTGNYRIDLAKARARKDLYRFFRDQYGFGPRHRYAWRRIDTDWLNPAESLALKLDSATNNTSLVLAIELPQSRRVLLFPGDAQVGNWKSWHEGGWSQRNGLARGETVTAEDLLGRTVLYKVGHHGSHNATLREKGLGMMTSQELVALIPVDQEWAERRRPHPWMMPFAPMYEDLKIRTRGRIVRTDRGVEPGAGRAWRRFPGGVPTTVVDDGGRPLYCELDIPDR